MRKILGEMLKAIVFASAVFSLVSCFYGLSAGKADAKEPARRSAWLAYWDLAAGEKDLHKLEKRLTSLSYFAAYFDKDDRLFIPPALIDKKKELQKTGKKHEAYLTFVNDKQNPDGSAAIKDTAVLRRLFADAASMEKHIDEILALALQGGFDGIEIDYERIWKDQAVGQSFLRFTRSLYRKTLQNNLQLRIVLEPGAPFAGTTFTEGPEYVVMLYNLHGLHSGPGPKADRSFIEKTLQRMQSLPGARSVAFATGGCLWGDNGEKRLLTEVEARTLATLHGAAATRDAASRSVAFAFRENGVSYQVWYADAKTLQYWTGIAARQGAANISLWRLGGNADIGKIR
ncbi:glycosyl hydrolase family 18 protein [Acetonema longum]|uniref:Uncharacterized protein n=1 Tax=Acetonema longum DSM 6540 TaxID=1009370 RepID=F7NJT1_9FIRM|nr:glycosyl hydrolase family 18 protein [Acetonema longum]EGO63737.1 hypothetical protein ALO_11694 [Acetonema longum DSM 6540]